MVGECGAEVENVWRAKQEERTKIVGDNWEQKLAEAHSHQSDGLLHEEIEGLKKRMERWSGLITTAEER